jgi:uncharacterized membrane protein YgcG
MVIYNEFCTRGRVCTIPRGARAERAHPGQRRRPNRVQGRCFRRPGADPGGVQGGGVQPGGAGARVSTHCVQLTLV